MLLSLHRFLQFARPHYARIINKRWQTGIATSCAAWIGGLIVTSFPLFGWGRFGTNGYLCGLDSRNGDIKTYTYLIFAVVLFYLLPIAIFVSTRVMIKMLYSSNFGRRSLKFQQRYMNMEAAMLLSFIICWTPYATVNLLDMFSIKTSLNGQLVCAIIAKVSSLINSPLYCVVYRVWQKSQKTTGMYVKSTTSDRKSGVLFTDAQPLTYRNRAKSQPL